MPRMLASNMVACVLLGAVVAVAGGCTADSATVEDSVTSSAAPAAPDSPSPSAGGPGLPSMSPTRGTGKASPESTASPQSTRTASISDAAALGGGVTVVLEGASAVIHEAGAPGELSGQAVDLDLSMANGAGSPVSLDRLTVTMVYGAAETPAIPVPSGADPFRGDLAPGGSASASYRFLIPSDERGDVRILVNYSAEQPTVILTGPLPE